MGQSVDGRRISEQLRAIIKAEIARLNAESDRKIGLATVMFGSNEGSVAYLKQKGKAATSVGIRVKDHWLPEDVKEDAVLELIEDLNRDESVHGIFVNLPIPKSIDGFKVIEAISPEKDVEGLTSVNRGRFHYNKAKLIPCVTKAVMGIMEYYDWQPRNVVIVNRSWTVGEPTFDFFSEFDANQILFLDTKKLFLNIDATITVCHSHTNPQDLHRYLTYADTVVTAVGRQPHFRISTDWLKPNSFIIDLGRSEIDGKILGDVDFEEALTLVSYVTPPVGGVGPVTVAASLDNTLIAAGEQLRIDTRSSFASLTASRLIQQTIA